VEKRLELLKVEYQRKFCTRDIHSCRDKYSYWSSCSNMLNVTALHPPTTKTSQRLYMALTANSYKF